ncbi:MAG: PD40 domain-containing protein, partial [Bacteroidetes bacterium]|nr:PD40 domain-containing protein [Bacteroidota bacterium]
MKNCFRIVICVGVLFALSSSCFSQNNFSSEDDLKKEASKLFEEDDFAGAFNLYSQLLSNYPKDPIYNYKFGVCMLMAGDNKETALTYLQYASQKQGVDKEATFYLGKAYHINYRFDEAIKEYTTYKSVASKAKLEKLQVDRQIEMCKNGKQLLSNLSDLYILDKKELNQSEYFRSYDLTDIGGKLLVKLEEFQTELDKKKKDNSIMYLAPKNNQIVFSSYGADGKNGRDIFLVRKQPNGEWSQPINIGPSINTKFDEDFPFLHPNGQVLYFCSKGHNSMGGYDVFKSTFNTSTNTWEPPVNVDFPINTPDDDVLYVTDAEEKTAFFSSARSSSNGKITVYKIGLEAKPIDALIVNGTISKDGKAVSNAKVTVKNVDNGELVGVYTVAPDGSYTLQVPNGGKLLVSVDMGEGKSYSELMVMPNLKEFKPLQQEIAFDATADKIQVKNKFDQAPSESNYMLALNFIKDKAKMDVNTNEAVYSSVQTTAPVVQASVDTLAKSTASVVDSVPATTKPTISNKDIVKIAYEDAKEALEEAKTLKQEADNATTFASQKNELVSLKQRELDNAKNELSSNQDEAKALTLNQKINELTVELDKLSKEAVVANNIAKKARGAATNKQAEADLSLEYAKELEQSIKGGGNANAAQAKLDAQKQKNEELAKSENTSENDGVASIKLDAENKQKEVDAAIKRKETIQKELVDMDKEIENLKTDAKKTKDDQLKQAINDQITDLEIDKDQKKQELTESDAKIKKLKDEALALSKEAELVSSLPVENKTNTSVVTTPTVAAIETSTTLAVKNNEPTVVTTNVAVIDTSKSQVNLAAQTIQTPSLVVTNSASVSPSVAVTPSNAVDTASKAIVVEKSTNSTEVGSASQNAELLQKQRVDSIEKIFVVEQE